MRLLLSMLALLVSAVPALAQTSYIRPLPFNQGYTITTPGAPTTYVRPQPFNQGYTATTPGYGTTYIRPLPFDQGYTVQRPYQ